MGIRTNREERCARRATFCDEVGPVIRGHHPRRENQARAVLGRHKTEAAVGDRRWGEGVCPAVALGSPACALESFGGPAFEGPEEECWPINPLKMGRNDDEDDFDVYVDEEDEEEEEEEDLDDFDDDFDDDDFDDFAEDEGGQLAIE